MTEELRESRGSYRGHSRDNTYYRGTCRILAESSPHKELILLYLDGASIESKMTTGVDVGKWFIDEVPCWISWQEYRLSTE